MSTSEDGHITIRQRLVRGLLGVVGALVVYALSIGPVGVMSFRWGVPSFSNCLKFYGPLMGFAGMFNAENQVNSYGVWWLITLQPEKGYEVGGKRFKLDSNGHQIPLPPLPEPASPKD